MTPLFAVEYFCSSCEGRKKPVAAVQSPPSSRVEIKPIVDGHCGACGRKCDMPVMVLPTMFGVVSHYLCSCANAWTETR